MGLGAGGNLGRGLLVVVVAFTGGCLEVVGSFLEVIVVVS